MDFNGRNDLSYGLVPVIIVFEVPLREKGFTKYLDEVNKVANSSRICTQCGKTRNSLSLNKYFVKSSL